MAKHTTEPRRPWETWPDEDWPEVPASEWEADPDADPDVDQTAAHTEDVADTPTVGDEWPADK